MFLANGKSVDATQELFAIGASNIVNSFAQGYPGTGITIKPIKNFAKNEKEISK